MWWDEYLTALEIDLLTGYSFWFFPLCLLLGFGYAVLLYNKSQFRILGTSLARALFVVRMLVVSLLAFLLLEPFISRLIREYEKPILVVGVDNSSSMLASEDSTYIKQTLALKLDSLIQKVGDDYQVLTYSFAEDVQRGLVPDFSGARSNFSNWISVLEDDLYNRHTAAVIVVTDGIFNQGIGAEYQMRDLYMPFYFLACGDTNQYTDIRISEVIHNKNARTGNKVPVAVNILAEDAAGMSLNLSLADDERKWVDTVLKVRNNRQFMRELFYVSSDEAIKKRFSVSVQPIDGEKNTQNNSRDFIIDFNQQSKKILLVYHAPHPDIAALGRVILSSDGFILDKTSAANWDGRTEDYDVLILHQLPSSEYPLVDASNWKIPQFWIMGMETDLAYWNQQKLGLSAAESNNQRPNEVSFAAAENFSLFYYNETWKERLVSLPPLINFITSYNADNSSRVFGMQKMGNTITKMPLITFNELSGVRKLALAGEGLWRWRLFEIRDYGNSLAFDQLIGRALQYLITDDQQARFEVEVAESFGQNEEVKLTAVFFNASMEVVQDATIQIQLANEEGQLFNYLMNPTEGTYQLNAGRFPVGIYRYQARVEYDGEVFTRAGDFVINSFSHETADLRARHKELSRLAENTGGLMLKTSGLDEVPQLLKNEKADRQKVYLNRSNTPLLEIKYIFLLLIFLLSLEWATRKYMGVF